MQKLRRFNAILILALLLAASAVVRADPSPVEEAAKLLPEQIGAFKKTGQVRGVHDDGNFFNGTVSVSGEYQSSKGERLTVVLTKHASDSGAYARIMHENQPFAISSSGGELKSVDIGTLGYVSREGIFFYKGSVYVNIRPVARPAPPGLLDFARQFAETLDKGDGEIPPLVKHLPGWETGKVVPAYAVNFQGLRENVPNQPVFEAINFAGGVEAVSASYDTAKLVIAEFNTPQLATENNAAIAVRIQQLRSQGQPAPTAYRRVGNYSVFVFDASSEQAANQLIDQVKYQQVVQWLGENPFAYEQATREFTETTLGVLVAVVKTSGLALVGCLAVGGFFGALLFVRRRAQQRAVEAYVDGGAMLRLNIDELTKENDPGRLLKS